MFLTEREARAVSDVKDVHDVVHDCKKHPVSASVTGAAQEFTEGPVEDVCLWRQ